MRQILLEQETEEVIHKVEEVSETTKTGMRRHVRVYINSHVNPRLMTHAMKGKPGCPKECIIKTSIVFHQSANPEVHLMLHTTQPHAPPTCCYATVVA